MTQITITSKDILKVIKYCVPDLKLKDFDDTPDDLINLKRIQDKIQELEQIENRSPIEERYLVQLRQSVSTRFVNPLRTVHIENPVEMVHRTLPLYHDIIYDKSDCIIHTLYKQYGLNPNYNYLVRSTNISPFMLKYDFPEFGFRFEHTTPITYTLTQTPKHSEDFEQYFKTLLYENLMASYDPGDECVLHNALNASERKWLLKNAARIEREFPEEYENMKNIPFCEGSLFE